ncbi:hypothetical protein D3228_02990 [Leucobacter luti]|nr:hypothetical protein [Leucobacter luti]
MTAVIAAIEAAATAAVGYAVVVVPALLLWTITFGLGAEPATVFAGAAGTWALAHFTPLTFTLTPEVALSFGLAPEQLSFVLSLAPLGITLITAGLATRAGWRLGARGGVGAAGLLGGLLGFGGVALVLAGIASPFVTRPDAGVAVVAALVYTAPAALAFLIRAARDEHPWWGAAVRQVQRWVDRASIPGAAALPLRAAEALRFAGAAVAGVVLLAAVAVTVALLGGYGEIVALTQHLQLDPLGSLLLFLTQLALLPVALLWAIAWLTGAGFAVGAGSSVTPFETLLGPVPALPLFGAIPQGWGSLGGLAPALVVLVGLALAVLLGRNADLRRSSWPVALTIPVLAAAAAGVALAGLTALSTGAIGPDRLAQTGPSPWLVGGLAAAELGGGLLLGTVALRIDASRLRGALPDAMPEAVRRLRGTGSSARDGAGTDRAGVFAADPFAETELDRGNDPDATREVDPLATERIDPLDAAATVDLTAAQVPRSLREPEPGLSADPESELVADPESGPAADPGSGRDSEPADDPEWPPEPAAELPADPAATPHGDAAGDPDDDAATDPATDPVAAAEDEGITESEALRAYSWEDTGELGQDAEPGGESRRGWRWPRSGR